MTQDQKQRLRPLLKKLVMEVKNELKEDNTDFDIKKQELSEMEGKTVKFVSFKNPGRILAIVFTDGSIFAVNNIKIDNVVYTLKQ